MAKQRIKSTTQDFIEIADISEDIVFFKGGAACMIIEVSSVNFFLLSGDEQNARIASYMSLLNSLSSSIEILIVSRRVDLGNYVKMLEEKLASIKNPKVAEQMTLYKDFIKELIKGEGLLDKKNYIIIPFSQLELGPVTGAAAQGKKTLSVNDRVKSALLSKRNNILVQIERMGLLAKPLTTEELIKLFYELLNQEYVNLNFTPQDIKNVII